MSTIKLKLKKCFGTGAAKGHGCGKPTLQRVYGLCQSCYRDWLLNSPEGKKKMERSCLKAHKKVEMEEKQELKQMKVEIMSCDEYRAKIVQPIFNEIARLIDYDQPCIATGYYTGKMNGGHYHSVGSNRTTALNLHNIHIQSEQSNSHKGGDNIKYREGLRKVYGQEYLDYVEGLKAIKPIHLSKDDLIEIASHARQIRNELKKNLVERMPEERIKLREEINQKIGIY
jgi:hypothetical protein